MTAFLCTILPDRALHTVPPADNMTYNLVEPFKGNALHTHPAVEIFIALDGRWEIAWGAHGEQTTVLAPGDLVAVPARLLG